MCASIPRTTDKTDMFCVILSIVIAEDLCGIMVKEDGTFAECIKRMVYSIFNKVPSVLIKKIHQVGNNFFIHFFVHNYCVQTYIGVSSTNWRKGENTCNVAEGIYE